MELVANPSAKPKMTQSVVRTETAQLVRGRSTYKLTYTSKLSISVGRNHASKLGKVSRWIPDFSGSPGFILQKFNEVKEQPSSQWRPATLGASPSGTSVAPSQFVALTPKMAAALFSFDYVEPLESFLKEEMAGATVGTVDGGVVAELNAHKEAITIAPPYTSSRSSSKNGMGTLVVGTTFSNFNVVRNMFSEGEFVDDNGAPQLLSQIVMTDTAAKENTPPMIRFSAPASDMLAVLKCEEFHDLIRKYCDDGLFSDGRKRASAEEIGDSSAKRSILAESGEDSDD